MNWLRRLFGKKEPAKTEIPELFPPIDKGQIRNTTHLIEQAETDGANERPASTSNDESLTERTIRRKCEQQQSEYIKNYRDRQQRHLSRLHKIHESWSVDAVQHNLQAMRDHIITEGKAASGPINKSADNLKSLAGELHHFRHAHGLLDRTPVYQDKWVFWLLLLIAFAAELALTAFFLKESGGLPTVLAFSTVYCILNYVVPLYIANKFGRWTNYRLQQSPLRKITGWLVMLIILGLGSMLNLLVGHYRSVALELAAKHYESDDLEALREIAEQVSNISTIAWNNFQASFLGIDDVWSWLLVVVGCVFFVAGLIEGFLKDDPYPEYGEKARRYSEQREKYDVDVSQLIEELQRLRKNGADAIENEKRKLIDSFSRDPELRTNIQAFQGQCEHACHSLNNDYQELINQYRQINMETRKTSAPSYFQREPQLSPVKIPEFEIPSEDAKARKNLLIKQLSESTSMLHREFEALINNIKPAQEVITLDPLGIRITE